MGFEALIRGLEVHCFGMPFYAGWGLTVDKVRLLRRWRRRSLASVFYAACILHSRYYNPEKQRPCSLEEVITYLTTARDRYQAEHATTHGSR
jgi:capsular polysaccharide export protein